MSGSFARAKSILGWVFERPLILRSKLEAAPFPSSWTWVWASLDCPNRPSGAQPAPNEHPAGERHLELCVLALPSEVQELRELRRPCPASLATTMGRRCFLFFWGGLEIGGPGIDGLYSVYHIYGKKLAEPSFPIENGPIKVPEKGGPLLRNQFSFRNLTMNKCQKWVACFLRVATLLRYSNLHQQTIRQIAGIA